MAMTMQELFYATSDVPAYFVHYGRQTSSIPYSQYNSHHRVPLVPQARSGDHMVSIFDLIVPMCCTGCEFMVQEALLGLTGVRDVVCDLYNQRVTITGHVDPVQAGNRVRNLGATLCSRSSYSTHRYERPNFPSTGSHRAQQINREGAVNADRNNRTRGETSSVTYTRTRCPGYTVQSNTASVNPTIATRVETELC